MAYGIMNDLCLGIHLSPGLHMHLHLCLIQYY